MSKQKQTVKEPLVIQNTSDLRKMLCDTIQGVRDGTIQPGAANAIAGLSTKILQSAKLDLDYLRFNKDAGRIDSSAPSTSLKLVD